MIIDFLIYKLTGEIVEIEEDDDECGRPFHGRLNVRRGSDDYICAKCLVSVQMVSHPSFDGIGWIERTAIGKQP